MIDKHYGVVYDTRTLALLRVIVVTHEDQSAILDGTHARNAQSSETYCTISHEEVALHVGSAPADDNVQMLDLLAIGHHAIRKHAGRAP